MERPKRLIKWSIRLDPNVYILTAPRKDLKRDNSIGESTKRYRLAGEGRGVKYGLRYNSTVKSKHFFEGKLGQFKRIVNRVCSNKFGEQAIRVDEIYLLVEAEMNLDKASTHILLNLMEQDDLILLDNDILYFI